MPRVLLGVAAFVLGGILQGCWVPFGRPGGRPSFVQAVGSPGIGEPGPLTVQEGYPSGGRRRIVYRVAIQDRPVGAHCVASGKGVSIRPPAWSPVGGCLAVIWW